MIEMFEDKKWSKILKDAIVAKFLNAESKTSDQYLEQLSEIIEMALEEGRQEVQDDPRKYDLYSEDDARSQEREPSHNEGYD